MPVKSRITVPAVPAYVKSTVSPSLPKLPTVVADCEGISKDPVALEAVMVPPE